ncbi:hypothetical protein CK203_103875 [Vitis vinifera]|uniref:Retrotransposon gag domain-containing protein n=1 Tax=Vitis vinifera TaxID=29760 RepID=A0A438E4U0_VITVI|nr:hypothetical protein CK203_103875 [Vitis vinifera]
MRRVLWNPWQSNGKLRNMKNQSFEVLCHKQIQNARSKKMSGQGVRTPPSDGGGRSPDRRARHVSSWGNPDSLVHSVSSGRGVPTPCTRRRSPLRSIAQSTRERVPCADISHPEFRAPTFYIRISHSRMGEEDVSTSLLILVVYAKWIRDCGGRLVKLETPHNKELEVILNIMETTPEDQHSHHDHQDNPNEFRSMRDRMHPPRMSAPSCIVPPTEQLVIRPHIVPLLPTFHGMESENPMPISRNLKMFDKAKIWLNSLRPRSIGSIRWTDLQAEFLKKFFPTHRTNSLKRQISNFSAKENEKFYECWERYMEAINACPHHGFDTWLLVSYFYDGMSSSMKQLLETMCGGDFMSKNPEEAMDFLSYVAEVSRGWDEPHRGEVGKMNYDKKSGGARTEKDDEVQAVAETPVQVKPCSICQSYEHLVEECPSIPVAREMFENKQMSLDNSSPIAMLRMAILTTQVGGIIQIFHGSQEHLSTNSRLNHLNHPNKLQVLNKQ